MQEDIGLSNSAISGDLQWPSFHIFQTYICKCNTYCWYIWATLDRRCCRRDGSFTD